MKSDGNFDDLENFTWCALVACRIAIADKKVNSEMGRHRFLMNWLRTAQKQKRFPRTVARDLDYFITWGTRHGLQSRLFDKIEYMYRSCGDITQQSDLFRLTYATELLKDRQWRVELLSDHEWERRKEAVSGCILSLRQNLADMFDDKGNQLMPVPLQLWGDNPEEALHLLAEYRLKLRPRACTAGMMALDIIQQDKITRICA
ncbi:DUF2913 family protein (plasmid) [Salmonella enterica subsp. enterica serovar Karamoja]|uniref:DUF2913 family protein n=1 Tax=Salmonella enterica subsp. enterica serovar Karamoja TaxID=2500153 RepID=A0A3Q9MXC8_SALET|nr:DUF2913 family protein [Salmonella enterica]AZT39702.1 DUF2913 family protein [Salmonella enterica subsp. enterica serovar Karamoja]AZT44396.1 DUF2913 family protein [Salmonella enterica subsp. enterica serovar Karamoja]